MVCVRKSFGEGAFGSELEEGLQNLGLGPSWGPESLEEESTLAPTWQLKEEKSSHVLMRILCCIMMMFA